MASTHFEILVESLNELKKTYLSEGISASMHTEQHQELARAFTVFIHAELEWYVERIAIELTEISVREATAGRFNQSTLSLLTFSGMESLSGGDSLAGKKANQRTLATRLGQAASKHRQLAESNEGVRERHLAKLLIPLGIAPNAIDSVWLADIDALATSRGAYAHVGRSDSIASHLGANPKDIWLLCERLIWAPATRPGLVSSFEELDQWFVQSKREFGAHGTLPRSSLLRRIAGRFGLA